jgi:LuxR family maltose regulon positive regulatory protein
MMPGVILHRDAPPFYKGPYYLERPRLDNILKIAMQSPVVAVVAGQGFGKTASVYSFLRKYSAVSIWIQLSEQDNNYQRFWENLCACITLKNPDLGRAMTRIGFPDTVSFFDIFYNMVEQAIKGIQTKPSSSHYVLVYDDFQTINNPVMLRLFDRILAFPFSKITVILISHTEPQVKTLPLISKGLLTRITAEELRFTPEEIAAYFALRHLTLSPEDLNSLYRDTEGWPQLLTLIAENTEKQKGRLHYSPELVKLPLFKIIEDSFFSSLDKNTRKFLIKLSLASYWPLPFLGELNDSVGDLESLSPFIHYDSYLNGYRIHHLLIEFLKEKQGELSPEERRELYLKSAQWCLKNNLRMDAATYYEKARDYQGLLDLCFTYPVVFPRETALFLLAIIGRLLGEADGSSAPGNSPENPLGNHPENSPGNPSGNPDGEDEEDRDARLFLRYAIKPRLLTAMGRLEESAAACREAIAKFEPLPPSAINGRILSSIYISLGFVYIVTCQITKNYNFLPLFEKGYGYIENYKLQVRGNEGQGTIFPYICQVGFPAEAGEYEKYLSNITAVVSLMEKFSDKFITGLDSLSWCEYYYHKGDLGAAENYARRSIIHARENHQYDAENRGFFFLLRIAVHSGNFLEIEDICRQIKVHSGSGDFLNYSVICDIEYAWLYAQTGIPALAEFSFNSGSDEIETDNIYFPIEILVKAKCFFIEKQYQEALAALGRWENLRGSHAYLLEKLEITVLEAACNLRLDRLPRALEKLEEAWGLSAANGLDMPFIELGEDMRLLASAALENPEQSVIPREWLETVRNKAAAYGKMLAAIGPENMSRGGGTVLRPSETAVLRALSLGFTREEISRKEGISFHNVKQIIKNIYNKLGAVNRADAVRIAIDKGFLKNFRR